MKKIILTLLLLLALPMQALAAENVQSMVDALPEVSVLQEMDMDRQREVYDRTQAAYDAYMALSEEEKAEQERRHWHEKPWVTISLVIFIGLNFMLGIYSQPVVDLITQGLRMFG